MLTVQLKPIYFLRRKPARTVTVVVGTTSSKHVETWIFRSTTLK